MKKFTLVDVNGKVYNYEATDMEMVLHIHKQLHPDDLPDLLMRTVYTQ